jgi:hypothetical protein
MDQRKLIIDQWLIGCGLYSDGTDNGDLVEIRRIYVQNGQVIHNSQSNVNGRCMQRHDNFQYKIHAIMKCVSVTHGAK